MNLGLNLGEKESCIPIRVTCADVDRLTFLLKGFFSDHSLPIKCGYPPGVGKGILWAALADQCPGQPTGLSGVQLDRHSQSRKMADDRAWTARHEQDRIQITTLTCDDLVDPILVGVHGGAFAHGNQGCRHFQCR